MDTATRKENIVKQLQGLSFTQIERLLQQVFTAVKESPIQKIEVKKEGVIPNT